ncbi:phosphotransferase family protein [Streptacidiphilus sp. N1-12]|uniref:Phosphotransferase family protein n=2 Tax=Streptacidiphilus alkalitolerans TaxID=3342712 RepID=A0ABV6W9L6_9ACTN
MSQELTVPCAGELFAELLPARGPVRAVSRFAEGSVTGAYRIGFAQADALPVVLKIYGTDSLWEAAKEARALRFLTGHGINISPRVLAFSSAADALGGRPCVVSSLRPGRTLTEVGDALTPAQLHEVYRQVGEVLKRLHAIPADGYGYVNGEIHKPLPDNRSHMDRMFERELRAFRENAADPAPGPDLADDLTAYVAAHSAAFSACLRPAYCHGDVHEPNLLVDLAEDGTCALTGLLDPLNMHAGDPLMDFVRLDAFSMRGDPTKIDGLLSGYGISVPGRPSGPWPVAWRSRLRLYRIALALELYNWFTIIGQTIHLPSLTRELRELVSGAEAENRLNR